MRSFACLFALAPFALAHAGTLAFDDPHPAFTLPATGTKTVCLSGTVSLDSFEKDPVLTIGLPPTLFGATDALAASVDPAFAAYLGENRFGASYRGPILTFALTHATRVGDYDFGDGIYPPFVYFGFGRYEPPQAGGGLLGRESYKVFYSVEVRPVPEPGILVALAAGVGLARRRRRA